ncbi:MAG TPA: hypothetical protein VD767_12290 [Thermomicrobiales bacterium]|nr:hypothetical protein [Thermomicrobiales bacterium]
MSGPESADWTVLVLLGPSSTGKSTAAREIGRHLGIPWLQVDDLRIAMQFSNAKLPNHNDALYWFLNNPDHMTLPIDRVLNAFIGTASALAPAVRIVIDSHMVTNEPVIIEGDGILPALCRDPVLLPHLESGSVRWCGIRPKSTDRIAGNLIRRGRGVGYASRAGLRHHAEAVAAFGVWVDHQCAQLGIPVESSAPEGTLVERILLAMDVDPTPATP